MWLNPRINGDDALRLNGKIRFGKETLIFLFDKMFLFFVAKIIGSKTVEKTNFERCWQLVADRAIEDRVEKRVESPRTQARKKVKEELKAIK
jgi:hypothetical protein